jgi:mono/diheme cytochrome c family protein
MRNTGRARLAVLAIAAGALLAMAACSGGPRGGGDPSRGHELAEHWCSECHRVSPSDPTGTRAGHVLPPQVAAPDFAAVARKPYADRAYLERFTGELHLPMPIYRLSEAERRDIVAYILTLKRP